jgi:hypothetical protein
MYAFASPSFLRFLKIIFIPGRVPGESGSQMENVSYGCPEKHGLKVRFSRFDFCPKEVRYHQDETGVSQVTLEGT